MLLMGFIYGIKTQFWKMSGKNRFPYILASRPVCFVASRCSGYTRYLVLGLAGRPAGRMGVQAGGWVAGHAGAGSTLRKLHLTVIFI